MKNENTVHYLNTIGKKLLLYIPLIFWTTITLFPFIYIVILATKSPSEIYSFPPPLSIGKEWVETLVTNYQDLLSKTPFWKNLFNSFYTSTMATLLALFFCSLGGYGFAMFDFKGKNFLFGFMVLTMMIPQVINIVPYFIMMKTFGWLNTGKALYLPMVASAYGTFLMRQFISATIHRDLMDAAKIDGCSYFQFYYKVVIPLIKPALGTLGIITFLTCWNNFMQALVVMRTPESWTIPVALSRLNQMRVNVNPGAIMLGTTIAVIPMVIFFFVMSKMIIARLTEGSLKG
ncbi:MAG: carbohydrate ABC transporter permease [Spirochaetes bacterium]|nr:carbohydrate ABC transporter permease [Spirochaetota bacterium]